MKADKGDCWARSATNGLAVAVLCVFVATCFPYVLNQPFHTKSLNLLLVFEPEHSLGLTAGQPASSAWSFTFSVLQLIAQGRRSRGTSHLHMDGNCCYSDFLEIGL